jgi:hypothetical protein
VGDLDKIQHWVGEIPMGIRTPGGDIKGVPK